MNPGNYTIHTMSRADLDIALSWAAQEGWNPGLQDADAFFSADPNGYFIGRWGNEPIGCISGVAYGDLFGFIGLYIVKPEFRGKGLGIQLWNAAMRYLQGRNIGLDGVIEQQPNYRKSGFRLAYRNIRCEGILSGNYSKEVIPLQDVPFEKVLEYDRQCFPVKRESFLRKWIQMSNGVAMAKWDGNTIRGFGVIRSCRTGFKIGPLFADDLPTAETLLLSLAHQAGGTPVYLDTPEINSAAVTLADRYNMKRVFETARMYTGEDPKIDFNKVFGVTTFELG